MLHRLHIGWEGSGRVICGGRGQVDREDQDHPSLTMVSLANPTIFSHYLSPPHIPRDFKAMGINQRTSPTECSTQPPSVLSEVMCTTLLTKTQNHFLLYKCILHRTCPHWAQFKTASATLLPLWTNFLLYHAVKVVALGQPPASKISSNGTPFCLALLLEAALVLPAANSFGLTAMATNTWQAGDPGLF